MPNIPSSPGVRLPQVPDPVLLALFRYSLTDPAIIPPPPTDDRERLMLVCRRWRTLISSSARFWATVVFLPVSSQEPGRLRRLAQTWLQRSQGVLVSIDFEVNFMRYNPGVTLSTTKQITYGAGEICVVDTIIIPCAERITSLKCGLATNATMRTFLTIPAFRFLSLHHVDLTLINQLDQHRSQFYFWEFSMFNVFHRLPCLEQITLRILNGLHPFKLQLPWNQLTNLYLGATVMPPEEFLLIIEMTPSLIEAGFHLQFKKQATCAKIHTHTSRCRKRPPFQTVVAYGLTSLLLVLVNPSRDRRIFKALQLPNLISFRVEVEDAKKGWDLRLYTPLLWTMPDLDYLSITPFTFHSAPQNSNDLPPRPHRQISCREMEDFFAAVPNIGTLSIGLGLHVNSTTLERMAKGELLPFLEDLQLGSVNGERVLRMVKQRNDQVQYYTRCEPTSSSLPAIDPIFRFVSLHLLVPEEDVWRLGEEARTLRNFTRSCADIKITVEGKERRLFNCID